MTPQTTGFCRSASITLLKAVQSVKEEWEDEEVVLNPRQSAELASLLRACKASIKVIDEYARKFEGVAKVRTLPTKQLA